MDLKIIAPLGPEAGRELEIGEALRMLAIEMLAHRSDLQEQAYRTGSKPDREAEQATLVQRAADLERYAVAVYAIAGQVDPERFTPETHRGLIELAEQHHIILPDWMKGSPNEPRS